MSENSTEPAIASGAELEPTSEALANVHLQVQAIMDHVPDRIYFKDTQSRFLRLSRALAKRMGVENPQQAIGKTDFDSYTPEKAREFQQDEQRILQTGEPLINKIERQVTSNGEIAWASVTKVPVRDREGNIVGLVGINRDITEQKHGEEELRKSRDELEQQINTRTAELLQERRLLRTLIDQLPDSIYAKDKAGRKSLANAADLKNLRCKTEADAIGKTDFDLFPPEIAAQFAADDEAGLAGNPVFNPGGNFLYEKGRQNLRVPNKRPMRK